MFLFFAAFLEWIGLFVIACSMNYYRERSHLLFLSSKKRSVYRIIALLLSLFSLWICIYQWESSGPMIWIGLIGIMGISIALFLGYAHKHSNALIRFTSCKITGQ